MLLMPLIMVEICVRINKRVECCEKIFLCRDQKPEVCRPFRFMHKKTIHIASVHKKSRKTTFMQSDKLQYMSWKHNDMIKNMVSLEIDFKQGQRKAWCIPLPKNLTLWPWKSIGFEILLKTKHVPSLVKIHWRMLILECSQGCYAVKIWPGDLDLWCIT